jgi:hypothetical protein
LNTRILLVLTIVACLLYALITAGPKLVTGTVHENYGWQPPQPEEQKQYSAKHGDGSLKDVAPHLFDK